MSEMPQEPLYSESGKRLGELVEKKNAAYGDAFAKSGEVLRIMYPNGISPAQSDDLAGVVRVLDKLFRVAHQREAFGESPWTDIAGYGLLGVVRGASQDTAEADQDDTGRDRG